MTIDHGDTLECEACGYTWRNVIDGYQDCFRCNPAQPKPLAERRGDPTEHLGPEYVWDCRRGPRGFWGKLEDYWMLPKPSDEEQAALRHYVGDRAEYQGLQMIPAILAELARLNGHERPRTAEGVLRMADLADRCQRLDEDLRRKRAECDELRDRIRELESKR